MHTELHPKLSGNREAEAAKAIIQACVHCGFCTATCPTYQHFHDERDGPRGRIYLIKQLLENNEVSASTQTHLDRCLTCRSCETTCPSGVRYGRLVDIGRKMTEDRVPRSPLAKFQRQALRQVVPYEKRFGALLKMGQLVSPVLPAALKTKVPPKAQAAAPWPANSHCLL